MFEISDYNSIFTQRGKEYEYAMSLNPDSRRAEFENLTQFIDNSRALRILDIPSGGGYLRKYLANHHHLLCAEETSYFYQICKVDENQEKFLYCEGNPLPLDNGLIDFAISLAGIHHYQNKNWIVAELFRVLKNNGTIIIADVSVNSFVAKFLNEFVDTNNSLGHKGYFLDQDFELLLTAQNFTIKFNSIVKYFWTFNSLNEMTEYCKNLFGLNKCTDAEIISGIEKYLGLTECNKKFKIDWELKYIVGVKNTNFL